MYDPHQPLLISKEQYAEILDNLQPRGIVVTKKGKPVARFIPENSNCGEPIGSMAGKIKVSGDLMTTGLGWDAESRYPHFDFGYRRNPEYH